MAGLFIKKNLAKLIADANDPLAGEAVHGAHAGGQLKRTLTAFNLTMLGIGAIIGAGIFSLTGTASANYAGPGIVYSFMIGGVLCALAGLCYAEMASMIPVAGSAYAYSYATMGEFIAWIIGWDLVLEYAFGAVTVSTSWSGYFLSLMHKTLGIPVSDTMLRFTKGPWEQVLLNDGVTRAFGLWNIPASFIGLLVAAILYRGMRESAFVNNLIVVIKVSIVLVFIGLGISLISSDNLFVNSAATGLAALVPAKEIITLNGNQVNAYGWGLNGVLTGAGVVFFAYIGFDAVSTTAQEAKNPKRDLPIGILGSLVICTDPLHPRGADAHRRRQLQAAGRAGSDRGRHRQDRRAARLVAGRADRVHLPHQAGGARRPHVRHPRHDDGPDAHLLRDEQGRPAALVRRGPQGARHAVHRDGPHRLLRRLLRRRDADEPGGRTGVDRHAARVRAGVHRRPAAAGGQPRNRTSLQGARRHGRRVDRRHLGRRWRAST